MIVRIWRKSVFMNAGVNVRYNFSVDCHDYKKYLSKHIIKIIEQKPQNFILCQQKFQQAITNHQNLKQQLHPESRPITTSPNTNSPKQQTLPIKLNMIFRIYTLPIILQKYKEQLSQLVIQNKIKNQSDLDRICAIITKNIKSNKNFCIRDIQAVGEQANSSKQKDREQFQLCIKQLEGKEGKIDITAVSKGLRQKFVSIDSKQIYERLKKIQVKNQGKQVNKSDKSVDKQKQKQKSAKQFWDKLQNIKPRLLPQQCNDPQVYKKHEEITNKKLRFRFPPQPNGYLHIGHIKSIRINFQTAKRYGGICFLRYDDTNPQTESHQYIQNILKNVRWLGYQPDYITYASDYFEQMIQFAIKLIKQGHAYVCDSPQIDIQRQRKQKIANQYRQRSIQQNLKMFPNLKQGQTLRLKLDPQAKNPTLRDPVIYRIKQNMLHPRTGNKYRIYPIYDFAHCICDSLQHIDYSLCSLQFQVRRQLYYKILDLLKLYKPSVWQYSRLNVEGSVISKRKIKALIQSHAIQSWSDPRLLTIGGLMNRGYTPSMLLNFIDKVNASRSGNQNIIQFSLLERQMRKQLFNTSQKSMIVLKPRLMQIQNIEQNEIVQINVELFTNTQRKQTRKIRLSKRIYIQQTEDLQINGIIILKYIGAYKVKYIAPEDCNQKQSKIPGKLQKIQKDIKQLKQQNKQYKVIHWISQIDSIQGKVTVYDKLLTQQNKVNQTSKHIYETARIPKNLFQHKQNINKYWQMQRLGYFKFDANGQFIRCTTLQ